MDGSSTHCSHETIIIERTWFGQPSLQQPGLCSAPKAGRMQVSDYKRCQLRQAPAWHQSASQSPYGDVCDYHCPSGQLTAAKAPNQAVARQWMRLATTKRHAVGQGVCSAGQNHLSVHGCV